MESVRPGNGRVRMSAGVYLTLVLVTILLSMGLFTGAMWASESGRVPSRALWILTVIAYLGQLAVLLVFWHRAWSSIQDGSPRTTPGKAAGFLLIPLFNLYWMFQAFWGFSQDFNAYIRERQLQVPALPEGLFLTLAILSVLSLLPFAVFVASIAWVVVQCIVVHQVCTSVTALADAVEGRGGAQG